MKKEIIYTFSDEEISIIKYALKGKIHNNESNIDFINQDKIKLSDTEQEIKNLEYKNNKMKEILKRL